MAASGPALRAHLSALAVVPDDALGLGSVALDLAGANHPLADAGEYLGHLDILADRMRDLSDDDRAATSARAQARVLRAMLADIYGYGPDDDEDDGPESDLIETIDSRRGSAESLGIITLEVLRRAGWRADGLNFAPRFLVRLTDDFGAMVIVDPQAGWVPVEAHHMRAWLKAYYGLAAELTLGGHHGLSNRAILVRLQACAKLRHLKAGRLEQALGVVDSTLLFAPEQEGLWRESAILNARLNHYPEAVASMEQFLARCSDRVARRKAQQMLADLRQYLS